MTNPDIKENSETKSKRYKFSLPHVFVILVGLIIIASIASWFIPAGEFERELGPNNRQVVVPGTFKVIESNPIDPIRAFTAIPRGLVDASLIVFAVFIIGGSFGVIEHTRIIPVLVDKTARKLAGKEVIMILLVMIIFSVICAFIGLIELSIFYIPVLIPICLALGLDTMTAVAIALISTAAGFSAALTNPFTIAIAQQIGQLELYSGMGYRAITLITITGIGILYVLYYANKVKKHPEISVTYLRDQETKKELANMELPEFDFRLKLTAFVIVAGFLILVFGIIKFNWYLVEISTVFILIALLAGLASGMNFNEISDKFVVGLQRFVIAAFAVGIARGIVVIFEEVRILDTIVFGISVVVQNLPPSLTAVGMLITQGLLNFLIPSGSGQTLVSMPIMFPIADLTGVTRQTAILALQFGDGLTNILYPTSGFLWACIGIAGIKFEQWLRFVLPLMIIWFFAAAALVTIAHLIGWS